MSQAYPLMRGTAPLIVALVSVFQMGDALSPVSYTLWVFLLTGLPLTLWAITARKSTLVPYFGRHWRIGIAGGIGTTASYGLALWVMTLAPVAIVAVLRETSILFGTRGCFQTIGHLRASKHKCLSKRGLLMPRRYMGWLLVTLLIGSRFVFGAVGASATLTPAHMREDLLYLRDNWDSADRSFSLTQKQRFNESIAVALEKVDTLAPADFALEISRAVALSRNMHTNAYPGSWIHQIPIRVWWFSDGLYVVRTHPDFANLLGARIEQIGQLSPEDTLSKVAPFISGTDAVIRVKSATFLTSPEVLYRIGAAARPDRVVLKLRLRDGTHEVIALGIEDSKDPETEADIFGTAFALLAPSDPTRLGRWLHVLDSVATKPLSYQAPTTLSWQWLGADARIFYLRSNHIWGKDSRYGLLTQLLDLVTQEIVPHRPKYVIVDLRFNTGGDFFNTVMFSEALPKLIPENGRIFVLVGPSSLSAALATAALLKGYGRDQVTLVGDTLSDNSQFWSEGAPMALPNSGIVVTTATRQSDWGNGCTDLDRCPWGNVAFGHRNVLLAPEIRITPTFADYASGRDPVLEKVLEVAR